MEQDRICAAKYRIAAARSNDVATDVNIRIHGIVIATNYSVIIPITSITLTSIIPGRFDTEPSIVKGTASNSCGPYQFTSSHMTVFTSYFSPPQFGHRSIFLFVALALLGGISISSTSSSS